MADLKITELAALTVVNDEDLIAIVDDPTGTASTKKIRVDDFQSTWHVGARVYNNANISIAHDTYTALTFNSEVYDTDSIHSTGTNTGRLTCQTSGKYLIMATISFTDNAAGTRWVYFPIGGVGAISNFTVFAANAAGTKIVASTIYSLSVGQYVTCKVYQSSGGALNVEYSSMNSPYFMMQRIG